MIRRQIPILSQPAAADLDQQLFKSGYSLPSLVELAGLACAEGLHFVLTNPFSAFPADDIASSKFAKFSKLLPQISPNSPSHSLQVLVCIGPGNNGADGLVAARLLREKGYACTIMAPKLLPHCESTYNITFPSNPTSGDIHTLLRQLREQEEGSPDRSRSPPTPPSSHQPPQSDAPNLMHQLLFAALDKGCTYIATNQIDAYLASLQVYYATTPHTQSPQQEQFDHDEKRTNYVQDCNLFIPHIILDAVFGFSFSANSLTDIRAPFSSLISLFSAASQLPAPDMNPEITTLLEPHLELNPPNPSIPLNILPWLSSLFYPAPEREQENLSSESPPEPSKATPRRRYPFKPLLYCIDIPSGWDVVRGDVLKTKIRPTILISLTAPKPFVKTFHSRDKSLESHDDNARTAGGGQVVDIRRGNDPNVDPVHLIGGSFVPYSIAARFHVQDILQYYTPAQGRERGPQGKTEKEGDKFRDGDSRPKLPFFVLNHDDILYASPNSR